MNLDETPMAIGANVWRLLVLNFLISAPHVQILALFSARMFLRIVADFPSHRDSRGIIGATDFIRIRTSSVIPRSSTWAEK